MPPECDCETWRLIDNPPQGGEPPDVTQVRLIEQGTEALLEVPRLHAEIARLRADLCEAADVLRAVGKAAIVVKPTLDQPYPDAPHTTPWWRHMHEPARNAYDLGVHLHRKLKEAPR